MQTPLPLVQALATATGLYKSLDSNQLKMLDNVFLTAVKGVALGTMTSIPPSVQRVISISSSVEEVIANSVMDPDVVATLMGGGDNSELADSDPINQTIVLKCPSCEFVYTRDV